MKKIIVSLLAVASIVIVVGCKNVPTANQPTNLIQPGIACAEEVVLNIAGVVDPAAIVASCTQFGSLAISDVVALVQTLLKQNAPPAGAAPSPLYLHLQQILANAK